MVRPTEYSPEVVDAICDQMVNGKGLLKICADDNMPGRTTIYRWLATNPEFRKRFAEAREALMDFYAEQILTIAFDESGDVILDQGKDGKTSAVANHAKVQRDRLKVDSLKWTASRLFPKRYGDKMELLGQNVQEGESVNKIELVGVQAGTLTTAQLASHSHTATSTDSGHYHFGVTASPYSANAGLVGQSGGYFYAQSGNTSSASAVITTTVNSSGSGNAHNNTQPTMVLGLILRVI